MQYDRMLELAVGKSRKSSVWENDLVLWSNFADSLKNVIRTQETVAEYKSMPKAKRDEIKDIGGFVGGSLKDGRRRADTVLKRSIVTLDLDNLEKGVDIWGTVELILGCAAVLYSTHSHTAEKPRLRLILPLDRDVTADEYAAIARSIASDIGIDYCDDTTFEASRLMYFPSCSKDGEYIYKVQDAPFLSADEQLTRYTDWKDQTQWAYSSRNTTLKYNLQKKAERQQDPQAKEGIVGTFCRVYAIEGAVTKFLSDIYKAERDGRYTFVNGSTFGGMITYDNGNFAYSHHGTDPASGRLCNSFDLVRIHKFGHLDEKAEVDTPTVKLPSYQAMQKFALEDSEVKKLYIQERLADFDEAESLDWMQALQLTDKGNVASTISNLHIILLNDLNLKGKFYFDEFQERAIVCDSLPWIELADRVSTVWTDADDAGLRQYIERTYKVANAAKTRDALEILLMQVKRHPVKEYLTNLQWDGIKRADTLFIDYLGAEDTPYTRAVTGKALLGAVARILKAGCKHDHMLVLVGKQGCRKSTTIAKLGKSWFSDSLYTMGGKEAYEQLQGAWIIEVGELAVMKKAEIENVKHFLTKTEDIYRAAYARRTSSHKRQCAFFGTTNEEEFLHDATGARRFWAIRVQGSNKDLTDDIVDQIWAEMVQRYKAGEQWYLDAKMEEVAKQVQEEHTESNAKQGLIEKFLNTLLPENWDNMDLGARLSFWANDFGIQEKGKVQRQKVCALEIWQELFGGDLKGYTKLQAREINECMKKIDGWEARAKLRFGKLYGEQRGYVRKIKINKQQI